MKILLSAALAVLAAAALWSVAPTGQPARGKDGLNGQPAGVLRPAGSGLAGAAGFDIGERLSNRDLALQSDLIVTGRAVDTSIFWANAGRNLFTLVNIAVDDTLKGDQGSTITVALPGGVDAARKFPIAMTYPGAPRISPDEEVFLFLSRADDEISGSYSVTGFAQGKFTITPGAGGAQLRAQGADKQVRVEDRLVSLSSFKEEIRSYLQ